MMNPGKVVDPYPITSNLRLGPDYRPPRLDTRFSFPTEGGWDRVAMRCVGVGECRRHHTENGVMCPSYLATREEKHSTRGRAHLLFEMMHGGPLKDRWKSDAVEDALDLCLGCKGCKHDCPVNVDMATYKAEFRSHYYAGRLRPRAAYSMGLIYWWSRAASRMPGLVNFMTQTPGISSLVKWAGGLSQRRHMPPYARETFRDWFAGHVSPNPHGRDVLLFPDTFNNFFRPETAMAAVRVLEAGGWHVTIPPKSLCCGRPLYDWGMLDRADALLRELLDALEPALARGTPVIGLEPACLAAFRDEVPALFPDDERAGRLKDQSFLLSEFVAEHALETDRPLHHRKALIQVHCHEHALAKPEAEKTVLQQIGVEAEIMPNGRLLRLRGREIPRLGQDRRARPLAAPAPGRAGCRDRRQRLQLPGADRAINRPQDAARGRDYGGRAWRVAAASAAVAQFRPAIGDCRWRGRWRFCPCRADEPRRRFLPRRQYGRAP
jgi:Fe-S oxidoreductase